MLKKLLPCSFNHLAALLAVDSTKGFPMIHIIASPHFMNIALLDSAARAKVYTKILDTCQKNSERMLVEILYIDINLLFWIISRVCKKPRVKSSKYAIRSFDNNTMYISLKECSCEQELPDFMFKLSLEMSLYCVAWRFTELLSIFIFDLFGKLILCE